MTSTTRERTSLHNLWRFMAFSKPYWPWIIVGSVAGLIRMVLPLYMPHFIQRVFDHVLLVKDVVLAVRLQTLTGMLPLFGVILFFHVFASIGRFYVSQIAATSAIRDLRFLLFDHLQRLSLAFHTQRPTGSIVSRVMNDVATAQYIFDLVFIQTMQQTLNTLVIGVMLLRLDWQWALVAFATVPIFLVTTRLISRPMRQASHDTMETLSRISGIMNERMSMIREVQAFTAETYEKKGVRREVEALRRYWLRQQWLNSLLIGSSEITRYLGTVVVLLFGVYRVLYGHATVGQVTEFVLYTQLFYAPMEFMANLYTQLHTSAAAADRVFEFLDTVPAIQDEPGAKRLLPRRPPEVQIDDVLFSYPTVSPVTILDHITFTAKPGWRVVLVGESGAGKSTLMNLLPRFYDLQGGRIVIDGVDIRTATLRSLRRAIGIVPQEAVLFTGTIWENILYGRRDAPSEEVRAAARMANAEEFILGLPNGYDTIVGERGVGLSGGQIQRIAIARAFLKNPPVLIMDEATSNLDAVSEAQVLEALDRLAVGRTTFIIAHRLSIARTADVILVLDRGRIVEQGTHEELLAVGGIYHTLWQRQITGVPLASDS